MSDNTQPPVDVDHTCGDREELARTFWAAVAVMVTEACLMMSLQEYEARQVVAHIPPALSRRKVELEPSSTTGLILEDRPPYGFFLSLSVGLVTSCLVDESFGVLTVGLFAETFQPSRQRRLRDTGSSMSRWWPEPRGEVCFFFSVAPPTRAEFNRVCTDSKCSVMIVCQS